MGWAYHRWKNSVTLQLTWSFKEERESWNRYNPRTAHWDKLWTRSDISDIRWSPTGMNIVHRQYSSGMPATTFPRRVLWLHPRGKEMLWNAYENERKSLLKWHFPLIQWLSLHEWLLICLLSEQFLRMLSQHPDVTFEGGFINIQRSRKPK